MSSHHSHFRVPCRAAPAAAGATGNLATRPLRIGAACAVLLLAGAGWLSAAVAGSADAPRDLMVAGYLERVQIAGTDLVFKARLDSGATLSSLNALALERFELDGEPWVRFDVVDPEQEDERISFEYPITRDIRIVQHNGEHQRRPVIELTLCIGGHHRLAEVSLVDRSQFTYQLLVGRNHLRDAVLIDPGRRYLQPPQCPAASDGSHDPAGG
ncbi:ATP-dependent zinc protease family protein [Achromobacter denitrificans]